MLSLWQMQDTAQTLAETTRKKGRASHLRRMLALMSQSGAVTCASQENPSLFTTEQQFLALKKALARFTHLSTPWQLHFSVFHSYGPLVRTCQTEVPHGRAPKQTRPLQDTPTHWVYKYYALVRFLKRAGTHLPAW